VCLGCAGLMAALGVLTLLETNVESIEEIAATPFLATYMILFALLLFFYELMWWMPVPAINRTLRKNFGFMYGLKGKGFYMIFVAFLCLGLMNEGSKMVEILGWATGISFLSVGVLHIFLIISNPDFMDAYRPPTAGLERSATDGQGDNVV
jgi:COPI associated protein